LLLKLVVVMFFFSSRRRHTRCYRDWSSDVCSSDLLTNPGTIGTVASVPRLMKGQGSIIATGAIRQSGNAKIVTITSTYDHRVIQDRKSTRLNSSHGSISYAVFCLKKKNRSTRQRKN